MDRRITELLEKYYGYLRLVRHFDPAIRARHDYENVFLRSMKDISQLLTIPLTDASVLVLGCGYNYADVVLYSTCCKDVVGLDVVNAFYRDGVWKTIHDNHTRESLGASFLKRYESRGYYEQLERLSGKPILHNDYKLLTYEGSKMPFKAETFDVVTSNAVLEHVEQLDDVMSEIHRITKPGGISYHLWHNYYSLSGGHAPEYVYLKHPWGHLRGKYKNPFLGEYTPQQITDAFSRYFIDVRVYPRDKNHRKKGIDPDFEWEGEDLLTEELRKELDNYPLEMLLSRGYSIIGRKNRATANLER